MTRRLRPAPALLAAALALGIGGCISVLPKQAPSQFYRFAAERGTGAPSATAAQAADRVALILSPVSLSRASAGDQMLAITGDQAAFIAGARWVSPAATLWEESVRSAFSGRSTRTRLLTRTEVGTGQAFLRLSVPVFEARYAQPEAAPVVTVRLNALLLHRAGPFAAERDFTAEVPAAENRVGAIVAAYDQAVEKVVTDLVGWTDANADLAAADAPGFGAAQGATAATRTRETTTRSTSIPTTVGDPRRR